MKKKPTRKLFEKMVANGVRHLGRTISPAPKDRKSIESAEKAYDILNTGDGVYAQTKYMGSYVDVYLEPALEDCYLVTRNGHRIHWLDKELIIELICPIYNKYEKVAKIVAGELLPWQLLGEGLIEREYKPYGQVYSDMPVITATIPAEITIDFVILTKSELQAKYKPHEIKYWTAALKIEDFKTGAKTFEKSLLKFNNNYYPVIMPFRIVESKIPLDYKDTLINATHCPTVEDLNYFLYQNKQEEGIIVRPTEPTNIRELKVRNNDYLHLIYGVDFAYNYSKYYVKRNVGSKLGKHKKQVNLTDKMLTATQDELISLFAEFYLVDLIETDKTL